MSHLLAIDIGNTNITAGVFRHDRLLKKAKIPTCSYSVYSRSLKSLLRSCGLGPDDIEAAIVSSVVPLALSRLLVELNKLAKLKIAILGRDVKVPIKNLYNRKAEVGQDRLANAFAAKTLYGAPCVVVDFGTAITFDIVSRKGEYLGGLILPGIELSLSSLYQKTALLPRVELKEARHIIGKDTVNSMRGGILFGFGAMCNGLVERYRKILGKDTNIIATGGNVKLIKKYAKSIQMIDEDLTLKGLNMIFHMIYRHR